MADDNSQPDPMAELADDDFIAQMLAEAQSSVNEIANAVGDDGGPQTPSRSEGSICWAMSIWTCPSNWAAPRCSSRTC